jgi:hypothetical protein
MLLPLLLNLKVKPIDFSPDMADLFVWQVDRPQDVWE